MKLCVAFFLLIILTGCGRDCGSFCPPHQVPNINLFSGRNCYCYCDIDHEGNDCKVWKGTKFIGSYLGSLVINNNVIKTQTFTLYIDNPEDSSIVYVNALHESKYMRLLADTASLYAQVDRGYLLSDPITGRGYLDLDLKRLTINYKMGFPDSMDSYTFIGLRQ